MDGSLNDKSVSMMNRINLAPSWKEKLGNQPETGMGYQDVEVTLKNGTKLDGIALNGEVLETLAKIKPSDVADVRVRSAKEVGRHSPLIG